MSAVEDFLSHFAMVKRVGRNEWTADCPTHQSQSRKSLTFTYDGEKMLVHCFGGCLTDAVLAAVGLTERDLFLGAAAPPSRHLVATYRYEDESGTLLYEARRYEPKDFRPYKPDGTAGMPPGRRVLYRLPHLAEQRLIFLVEGEKDADRLAAGGLAATTTQGGANSWRPEYAEQLKALAPEDVIVLPDHDETGEAYAAAAVRDCVGAGLRVRVLRLPNLPPHGDVSDWLSAGGTVEGLRSLADATPFVAEPPRAVDVTVHWAVVLDELLAQFERGPAPCVATPYHNLNRYLSGGFSPGELVYLGAYPGVGKTALLLEFARGAAERGHSALIFSREMVNLALARRLLAQGARVSAAGLRSGYLGEGDRHGLAMHLPKLRGLPIWLNQVTDDIDAMAEEVARFAGSPPLGLVLVDYLQLVRGTGRHRDRRIEVESVSKGLKAIALRHRLPVICASSLSRGPRAKDDDGSKARKPSIDLLRESGELEHDADIILLLHREFQAEDTTCKVAKNRDGHTGDVHLRFLPDFVAFNEVEERGDA